MPGTDENKAPRPPLQVPAELKDQPSPPETKNVFEESQKNLTQVAEEVARGEWGEGDDLRNRLAEAGFDHREVRDAVVRIARGQ